MVVRVAQFLVLCLSIWSCDCKQGKQQPQSSQIDYSDRYMWYACDQNEASQVDVFYITPTCIWDWTDSTGVIHHSMDVNNKKQRSLVDAGGNVLAHALFTKSCRFYSPYYSQITLDSWMQSSQEIESRYRVAHQDVVAAFEYYMKNLNNGRPFILAGHSQGAKAVVELLKYSVSEEQFGRMVAAFVFGFEAKQSDLDNSKFIVPAKDSLDVGVVVCYNSVSNVNAISPTLKDNVVCINPINWAVDSKYAAANENLGSVFFKKNGTSDTLFHKVGAKIDISNHTVVIDGLNDDEYYIPSIGAIFPKGNYHVNEINLYFLNLQKNIGQRIDSFLSEK